MVRTTETKVVLKTTIKVDSPNAPIELSAMPEEMFNSFINRTSTALVTEMLEKMNKGNSWATVEVAHV